MCRPLPGTVGNGVGALVVPLEARELSDQHLPRPGSRRSGLCFERSIDNNCGQELTCSPMNRLRPRSHGIPDSSVIPGCTPLHHIGASTRQAQDSIASAVVSMLRDYARGQVRKCRQPRGCSLRVGRFLTIRHMDRVGVLSAVLTAIRSLGLNVQNMSNQIFSGAGSAVAVIQVQGDAPGDPG